MCGIAGFVGNGTMRDLEAMARTMAYRGPDADGYWCDPDGGVYLAHRRLSIIDLATGAQPMWTKDGSLGTVYNGEIYNHAELREDLEKRGHRFQSDHSDTEVLLHGYREWGETMPERLNGMWAFAIFDRENKSLFLSRDRFGKKPLCYSLRNGTFAFSSEVKSLAAHTSVSSEISPLSLKKYFAYGYIPAPHTIYKGVSKLPAGHSMRVDTRTLEYRIRQYWDFVLEPFEEIPADPENEWGEHLRELLSKAVRRRLISDVPLGVFLSGGIDSSSIAAYATEHAGKGRVKTFCVGFSEDGFDESRHSSAAASFLGTNHRETRLSVEKAREILPEIFSRLDEPFGDSSLVPTWLLCRETRKQVAVALGGDGADELFAGYDPFRALKIADIYEKIVPKPVHGAIRAMAGLLPASRGNMGLDFKIKRTLLGMSYPDSIRNPVWLAPLEPSEFAEFFQEPADIEDIYSEAIACWDNCNQKNILDRTLQFYTKIYLGDGILTKVDRAGMLNSLEVRAPYLDIDLVDFARRIPSDFKFRGGQTKYLLKKALKGVLPDDIVYRPKHGFGMPVAEWFAAGKLRTDFRRLANGPRFTARKIREHRMGKDNHKLFLWNAWVLDEWFGEGGQNKPCA